MHSATTPHATYKQSDERPAITDVLLDEDGNAVDLTNAQSVTFLLQEKSEYENNSNTLAINATASFVDAANGKVEYVLQDGDLDVAASRYYGTWRVSWPDQAGNGVADDQTFPQDGLLAIDVEQAISGSVDPSSAPNDLTVTRLTASEIAGSVASGNVITDLVGKGLRVDGSGVLHADTVLASKSITLSGGSSPAFSGSLTIGSDQLQDYYTVVSTDADPAFNGDYEYNYDYTRGWDDSASSLYSTVTVNWDVDPGGGNDVSATASAVGSDL